MMQNPDQKENTRLSEEMLNKYASDGLPKAGGFDAAEVLSILRLADAEDWKLSGTLQEHQFRNIRDSLSKMHVSDGYFLNYGESELIPKLSPEDWEAILSEGQENRREGFLRTVSFPASGIYAVEGEHLYLSVKTGNNAGAKKHRDTGSFIIYANHKPLLVDPGKGSEGTAESPDFKGSAFHNLPTIEGFTACGDPDDASGKYAALDVDLKRKQIFPGVEGYLHSMELRGCYPEEAPIETYIREIRFISDGPVEVTEHLRLRDDAFPHWELHFMSEEKPEYLSQENTLRLGNLGRIRFDRPILQVNIEFLDTSEDPNLHTAWRNGLYRTSIRPLGGVLRYLISEG